MKADYDVELEWRAFELHPEIPLEGMVLPAHVRARFGGTSEWLKEMAREAGMEMVMPEVIPNSRRALETSEYARKHGKHEEFHRVVFRKLYGEGQNISRWDILCAAAEEVDLDPQAMKRETEAGKYRAVVDAQINQARTLGITGVPTYVFNDKYAIIGAQPYEVFQRTMVQLMNEARDGFRLTEGPGSIEGGE